MTVAYSDWLPSLGICIIYACALAVTHSFTVRSSYKYYTSLSIYETSPFYKKKFCDHIAINIWYSTHCAQCVMVSKTALCCVMGSEIVQMWQCRPSTGRQKSHTKKCLSRENKRVNRTTFAIRTTSRPYETRSWI